MKKAYYQDLANDIHMQNEFNRIASHILEHVKEQSKAFIGKKITTLKGVTEKFKAIKPENESYTVTPLPGSNFARVHRILLYADASVEISLCFDTPSDKTGCIYKTNQYYFGKVEDGILTMVNDLTINTDPIYYESELFAIEELLKLEEKIATIKKIIRVNESAYKYISLPL
jgi:hypothetical protein